MAQGQENSARADLSFIERVRFARNLEQLGYDRGVIMAALSVDKTTVSRMISVATRIPVAAIDATGPAPGIGRPRWVELAELFEDGKEPPDLAGMLEGAEFQNSESDRRFDLLYAFVTARSAKGKLPNVEEGQGSRRFRDDAQHWAPGDGGRCVSMTHTTRSSVLAIDRRQAPGFAEFILAQMDRLYGEYLATKPRAASKATAVRRRG